MAEVFGMATGVAGMASLAIQLMESSQKLHALYHTSKDAPDTVNQLSFELTTLSKHILQLERMRHRPDGSCDADCDEMLSRCLHTCARMSAKIKTAVDKVDCALQKSRFAGSLYMAFKESEIRKLLEEMEQAKTSMILAHLQYIESWKMQQIMNSDAICSLLSSQQDRLEQIERALQTGQADIIARITKSSSSSSSQEKALLDTSHHSSTSQGLDRQTFTTVRSNGRFSPVIRISLPRWFTTRVWEFGSYDMDLSNARTFQLRSINVRPFNSAVFEVVRSGNVEAVRKLLTSGDLLVTDHASPWRHGFPDVNLIMMAAEFGHVELCNFLYRESAYFREDNVLLSALRYYIRSSAFWYHKLDPRQTDALYHLFVGQCGLLVDLSETAADTNGICLDESTVSTRLLTKSALEVMLSSQPIPFKQWSFALRFATCMRSQGWPADVFLEAIKFDDTKMMVTQTDREGRTALHWAAEHLGYCLCQRHNLRDRSDPDLVERRNGYRDLVSRLIRLGADAHAVDAENRSPFLAFSAAMRGSGEEPDTIRAAVQVWGEAITSGSTRLSLYTAKENRHIDSSDRQQRTLSRSHTGLEYILEGLEVCGSTELTARITVYAEIEVWQFRLPPGAWDETYHPQTICPQFYLYNKWEDTISWKFWEVADCHKIRLGSLPIAPDKHQPQSSLSSDCLSEVWRDFFLSTQDDHGPTAAVASRSSSLSESAATRPRRSRARSFTRSVTPWTLSSHFPGELTPHVTFRPRHWLRDLHKCSLSSKWSAPHPGDIESQPIRAECLLHGNLPESRRGSLRAIIDSWEKDFIEFYEDLEKVRRFVDRFCPQGIECLDDRLELQSLLGKSR